MTNIEKQFTESQAESIQLIKEIEAKIIMDGKLFNNMISDGGNNWGYVGSINKVAEDLKEISRFLGVSE